MSNTRVILYDSFYRSSGTLENPQFSIPKYNFTRPITAIQLLEATIPVTWFELSGNYEFQLIEGTDPPILITVDTETHYDVSTLAAALQNSMNTAGTLTYTISFLPAVQRLVMAGSGIFSMDFSGANSLGPVLGFGTTIVAGLSSYTAPSMVNFILDKYVFLHCNLIPGFDSGTLVGTALALPSSRSILAAIPIRGQFTTVIEYDGHGIEPPHRITQSAFYNLFSNSGLVEFWLSFPSGRTLSLNGHSFAFRLLFHYDNI